MKHLYRILAHGRVDVVAADTAQQALGVWESQRVGQCDPEADTAQCEQVPDKELIGTRKFETAAWLADMYGKPGLLDTLDRGTVLLHLGGAR